MRIDKFLKVSRILKKREIAKQLALNNRLYINDKNAKASSEVNVGDVVKIEFGHREIVIKILDVRLTASKEQAFEMYRVIDEKKDN